MTATMPQRRRQLGSPHDIFTGRRTGALPLRPKLARDGADGVIDRSQDARHSESPSGLLLKGRLPVWNSRRGTHLGSGHVRPRQQTGHMIAIASIRTLRQILQAGGRPHMGRGLHGRYPPSPVPVQGSTSHPGRNAGRHDAQAAREQTANPPAGTALAPMTRCASAQACPPVALRAMAWAAHIPQAIPVSWVRSRYFA